MLVLQNPQQNPRKSEYGIGQLSRGRPQSLGHRMVTAMDQGIPVYNYEFLHSGSITNKGF